MAQLSLEPAEYWLIQEALNTANIAQLDLRVREQAKLYIMKANEELFPAMFAIKQHCYRTLLVAQDFTHAVHILWDKCGGLSGEVAHLVSADFDSGDEETDSYNETEDCNMSDEDDESLDENDDLDDEDDEEYDEDEEYQSENDDGSPFEADELLTAAFADPSYLQNEVHDTSNQSVQQITTMLQKYIYKHAYPHPVRADVVRAYASYIIEQLALSLQSKPW
jgi:hypothetical protein